MSVQVFQNVLDAIRTSRSNLQTGVETLPLTDIAEYAPPSRESLHMLRLRTE